MTAYVISDAGEVAPDDQEAWRRYLALAPEAIRKYGGRYLARGGTVKPVEGGWTPKAIIIAEFPDMAAVERWYASPEYAEALKVREGTQLSRRMICVEGAPDDSAAKLLG